MEMKKKEWEKLCGLRGEEKDGAEEEGIFCKDVDGKRRYSERSSRTLISKIKIKKYKVDYVSLLFKIGKDTEMHSQDCVLYV